MLQALLRRLRAVADRAGRGWTVAGVAVAWALSRPAVGGVILGARGQGHVAATVRSCAALLSAELLAECTAAAEATLRPVKGEVYELERERDGPHGRIMRYNLQAMGGEPYALELEERAAEVERTGRAGGGAEGGGAAAAAAGAAVAALVDGRRRARQARQVAREAARLGGQEGEAADVRARAKAVASRMARVAA